MDVEFTQYLRPAGATRKIVTPVTPEVFAKSREILDKGYTFAIEVTSADLVIMWIVDDEQGEDLATAICANGREVPGCVERLIMNFNLEEKE